MKLHSVIHRQEVRFVDIDVMGHVNNAVYLNYFEQARMKWFEKLVGKKWDWYSAGILLARNEINYREPVRLEEEISVEIWCSKVGSKSLQLNYEVFTIENEIKKIKADALSVLVCFDYHKKQTIEVPAAWRSLLERH